MQSCSLVRTNHLKHDEMGTEMKGYDQTRLRVTYAIMCELMLCISCERIDVWMCKLYMTGDSMEWDKAGKMEKGVISQ